MAITTTTASDILAPLPSTPILLSILLVLALLAWTTTSYLSLAHIPGPLLCHLTNLPRASWILSNSAHATHIALHETHGPLVRFGPNMLSVADPREIPTLYAFTAGSFRKSDFYRVLLFHARGKPVPTIFATQDEGLHRMLKRPIAGLYGMSNLLTFEPLVDRTIEFLGARLEEEFVVGGGADGDDDDGDGGGRDGGGGGRNRGANVCDLGQWLQMFAFDVMGELTFSRRLGFLETAADVEGIMGSIWAYFWKTSPVSQIPWVDRLWAKNPILQRLKGVRMNPIVGFGLAQIAERKAGAAKAGDGL